MFMVLKKKQMIISALVIMLGIAGYLNYKYDNTGGAEDVLSIEDEKTKSEIGEVEMVDANPGEINTENEEDFFASQRFEREKAHAKTKEELENILSNPSMSEESKKAAEERLSKLSLATEHETTAENILKAKGFKDVLVHINVDSVNVTIKTSGLSSSDTAKIIDAVFELTKNNNIKIVEVE